MNKRLIKFLPTLLIIGIVFSMVVVVGTFTSIYSSVSKTCNSAKIKYSTDCVNAMIENLESKETSIEEKNHLIWVLGQLADARALSVLGDLYTAVPDHNEPLDKEVSQYELSKAIRWCENGNLTSWMYKSVR